MRGKAEAALSAAAGRSLTLGGISIDWGTAGARDLVVRYGPAPTDPVLLRVGEVRAPAGITAAFASRYDLETVRILRPEVRLDLREFAKPAAPAPAPSAGGGGSGGPGGGGAGGGGAPIPPFSLKVEIREGTLIQVGLDGKETALGTFDGDLAASDAGPATAVLQANLGPRGKFRVEVQGTPFRGGRPLPPSALEGTAALVLDSLDLGLLLEAARAVGAGDLSRLEGTLSGKGSVRLLEGSLEDGRIEGALRGLAAEGAALGEGVRIAEPSLDFSSGFRRGADGQVEVRDLHLAMERLEVRGGVVLPASGGALQGSVEASGDVRRLVARAKSLGIDFPGDASGEFRVEGRAEGTADARRWSGSAAFSTLMVSPGPGRAPLEEPSVALDFDGVLSGGVLRVDSGTLRSRSLALEAKGSVSREGPSDLSVTGTARLARLADVARGLGASLPGEIAGDAALDLRLRRAAPGAGGTAAADEARGTVVVTGLSLTPPGEGALPVREERFEVSFDALPGKEEVEVRSLRVKGAGLSLEASGRCAADGGSGRLAAVAAEADLARIAAVARAFGREPPVRLAGALSFTGPISWSGSFAEAGTEAGVLEVRDLVAVLPAAEGTPERTLRESSIRAVLDGTASRSDAGMSLALKGLTLRAEGLEAAASGAVAADGTLSLGTSGTLGLAAATRRLAALGLLGKDPSPRGALAFDLAVRGKPEAAEVSIARLELEGAEADLRVTGTGSAGGAVDLRAEGGGGLAAILDLAARAGLGEPAPDAQGRAALRLRASAADGKAPLQVASEISLAGLSWPAPGGGAPWRQEKVTAALDGSFDRSEETALFEARIASDGGAVAARGSAVLASGRRSLDAAADLDIDLGSLTRARPDLLPLDPMEIGRAKGKVALKGALPEPLSLRGLAGTAFLALDSVRTEAFELRDASVDAILQGGVLRARSVDGTVNGGKVAASGILSLDAEPGDHVLDLRAEGVQVDRAMAWLLKQVVPLFAVAETGTVAGRLKLDLHLEGRGADWKGGARTGRPWSPR